MQRVDVDWQRHIATHSHSVVLSLLARGVRLGRAKELTHETWARLFEQHEAGLLPRLELPGLAIRQASFLAMRELGARRSTSLDEAPEVLEVADPGPTPEVLMGARQQLGLAQAELAKLTPRARQLFTTALEQPGAPHASLAAQVGVSLQRFRQTLCEVRAKLRRAVDDEGAAR